MHRLVERMGVLAATMFLGAPVGMADGMRLNEIYASMSGIDTFEYIELVGPPGTSLDGFVVLVVEGEANTSFGFLDDAWDLTGLAIPSSGYFVLGNALVTPPPDLVIPDNTIENGTETFYILETVDVPGVLALVGTDVDPDDDGTTIIPSLGRVHDLVAVVADSGDFSYDDAGRVGPDGSFFPAGVFRDISYPGSWCSESFLDFTPGGAFEPQTPGAPNGACPPGAGGPETVSYCTSGASAVGCFPNLWSTGIPSASAATGFSLTCDDLEGAKDGIFYYGTNGRMPPWTWGTTFQCVAPPVHRAGLRAGSGTSGVCDGRTTQDLNALWAAKPLKNPGAGTTVQAQFWYRDPLNTSFHKTGLSHAVEFIVKP